MILQKYTRELRFDQDPELDSMRKMFHSLYVSKGYDKDTVIEKTSILSYMYIMSCFCACCQNIWIRWKILKYWKLRGWGIHSLLWYASHKIVKLGWTNPIVLRIDIMSTFLFFSSLSPHLTLPYLTSPHLTSPHLSSPHLTFTHLTSPLPTSAHLSCPLLFCRVTCGTGTALQVRAPLQTPIPMPMP